VVAAVSDEETPVGQRWSNGSPRGRGQCARIALAGALLLVRGAGALQGQEIGDLRVRVIDETGRRVPFAQVEIVPTSRRLVTDQNGEFFVPGLPDGEYDLRVKRIGYLPATVTVRVPQLEPWVTVTLGAVPTMLDSVRIRERGPARRYTGVVLDDHDQPVTGAEVIAAGASDHGVRTDSAGYFRLLKAQRGTLVLRIRKPGYTPYFGSLRLMGEREDTLRMTRLAQDLPTAYILAESGFGRDTFFYAELDARMRWKSSMAAIASREDLDPWGDMDLCQALTRTAAGGTMQLRERGCSTPRCVLIDGVNPTVQPLNAFQAAEVEAFEYHPRDLTGTIASRVGLLCGFDRPAGRNAGGVVIWLRRRP
jgi:hypothetical protein